MSSCSVATAGADRPRSSVRGYASRRFRAGLLYCLATGCGAPPEVPPAFSVRDSAGVRIVESYAPRLADSLAWRLALQPRVVIGTDEHTAMHQLHRVTGAARLSDGRIVIADGSPPHLRWFSPAGLLLQTAGRRGSGPGEFPDGHFTNVWRMGDSVAVWEHSRRRMQVFDDSARYARSVLMEARLRSTPVIVGRLSDGGFITYPNIAFTPSALGQVARTEMAFFHVSADGRTVLHELGTRPGPAFVRLSNTMPWTFPYAAQPAFAASDGRWYYGLPTGYEIEVRRPDGELELLIRRRHIERTLHADEVTAFRDAVVSTETPERARSVVSTFAEIPWPDVVPAFGAMVPDAEGNIWVMDYSPAFTWPAFRHAVADSITWSVFDSDGIWITDVRIPGTLDVLEIGSDYLLALTKGPLGTDVIQLHDVNK
jgi:hypothetical protein